MVFGKVFDFVKDGVQEMLIHRPDDKKNLVIYKHPENTIPKFSQLTVDADEAAVFFRDGSVIGTMRTAGAGQRHMLDSQNIPFLSGLVDSVTGGNIFITDLYFVTMRPIFDQRFGGELGYVEDPMLGEMVTPRIFGKFAFQVVDPARFIVNYVGMRAPQGNEEVLSWIKEKFRASVKTVVGDFLVTQQKSFLQLMPLQEQLARAMEANAPDLASIGVKILEVGDFNLNLSDDDEATLKTAQSEIGAAKRAARVANIGIAQAQAEAQQRQFELDQDFQQDSRYTGLAGGDFARAAAGKAMIGAGQGMAQGGGGGGGEGGAGGGMMAGAGMGVGFGMAQAMGGMFQGGQQAQPAPAAGSGPVTCGSCNATVPAGKFCAECGATLSPSPRFCPSCGQQNAAGSKFCSGCGTSCG